MALRLYNTLTRQKELFEPVQPGKVGIYLCGPTVYKESHIGHAIGPVIFDALKKYLVYKGYQVKFIINITDVDDKIIAESQRLGITMEELARRVTERYFEALHKLGVTSVDHFPRATDHIGDIIGLIQRLGENQAAYTVDGDVYFDIAKCSDYGKLSNRKSEEQLEGSRELAGAGKHHPGDFALWKAAGESELGWDSPWGKGRPGWHIECSAMSMKHLGETYDIHGGGMDLIFPHHENEIAQSETATCKPFVKYWLHNGLTRVVTKAAGGEWKSEKMSKSLGNIRPILELLEEYPPQTIRFFLLCTHYRRPIDFSDEAIQTTQKGMMNIYRLLERAGRLSGAEVFREGVNIERMGELAQDEPGKELARELSRGQLRFLESLDDDFNTAGAIAVVQELTTAVNRYIDRQQLETRKDAAPIELMLQGARMITTLGQIIGLLTGPIETRAGGDELTGKLMELLIALRDEARKSKNFALADVIRNRLKELGVVLEDRPDSSTNWKKE